MLQEGKYEGEQTIYSYKNGVDAGYMIHDVKVPVEDEVRRREMKTKRCGTMKCGA